MINAYVTGKGVINVSLTPPVPSLGTGAEDEYALRNEFLNQLTYYSNKDTPGEVVGVIDGTSAKATLFDDGSAIAYFWKTKKRLTVKWTRV